MGSKECLNLNKSTFLFFSISSSKQQTTFDFSMQMTKLLLLWLWLMIMMMSSDDHRRTQKYLSFASTPIIITSQFNWSPLLLLFTIRQFYSIGFRFTLVLPIFFCFPLYLSFLTFVYQQQKTFIFHFFSRLIHSR